MGSIALYLALPRPVNPGYFIISSSVLMVLTGAGLYLSYHIGLTPLFITGYSPDHNMQKFLPMAGRAALIGVGLGTLILGVIRFILSSILPIVQQRFAEEANIAVWKRVVIAFDSSVIEEIIFRLFLFPLLIWVAGKIWQVQRPPTSQLLWIINAFIAIGFGVAHLPQWFTITPLTLPIILTVVFLSCVLPASFP